MRRARSGASRTTVQSLRCESRRSRPPPAPPPAVAASGGAGTAGSGGIMQMSSPSRPSIVSLSSASSGGGASAAAGMLAPPTLTAASGTAALPPGRLEKANFFRGTMRARVSSATAWSPSMMTCERGRRSAATATPTHEYVRGVVGEESSQAPVIFERRAAVGTLLRH